MYSEKGMDMEVEMGAEADEWGHRSWITTPP